MINEEKKYTELTQSLKKLKKIEAPSNFETDLMRKINQSQIEGEKKFWKKLWNNIPLIPSTAGIATAGIVLFFFFLNKKSNIENNFMNELQTNNFIVIYYPLEENEAHIESSVLKSEKKSNEKISIKKFEKSVHNKEQVIMQNSEQLKINRAAEFGVDKDNSLAGERNDSMIKQKFESFGQQKNKTETKKNKTSDSNLQKTKIK